MYKIHETDCSINKMLFLGGGLEIQLFIFSKEFHAAMVNCIWASHLNITLKPYEIKARVQGPGSKIRFPLFFHSQFFHFSGNYYFLQNEDIILRSRYRWFTFMSFHLTRINEYIFRFELLRCLIWQIICKHEKVFAA